MIAPSLWLVEVERRSTLQQTTDPRELLQLQLPLKPSSAPQTLRSLHLSSPRNPQQQLPPLLPLLPLPPLIPQLLQQLLARVARVAKKEPLPQLLPQPLPLTPQLLI